MKIILMLLAGVIMLSVVKAGDKRMSKRAQALISGLNVKKIDLKKLQTHRKGALSKEKFKEAKNLIVSHKTETIGKESALKLTFSDKNGKALAFGKIKYAKSGLAAQSLLFERLAMNSLPLELLLKRYKIKDDGPGDLCIVEMILDKSKKKFVVDESQLYFIRNNTVVSVNARDASVKAEKLAIIIDEKLTSE